MRYVGIIYVFRSINVVWTYELRQLAHCYLKSFIKKVWLGTGVSKEKESEQLKARTGNTSPFSQIATRRGMLEREAIKKTKLRNERRIIEAPQSHFCNDMFPHL